MNWKIIHTDAKGYHDDLKQAVRKTNLTGPVLTMPSDVPAITGAFLDKVVCEFEQCGKDFLAVFVPIKKRLDLDLSISSTDEYQGVWYAVSGINIINGTMIQKDGKIETSALITEETEVLLNINTLKDVEIAQKIINANTHKSI
jgi:GTP:adenosylcobinamide-phosphate guanylyltransferase